MLWRKIKKRVLGSMEGREVVITLRGKERHWPEKVTEKVTLAWHGRKGEEKEICRILWATVRTLTLPA